MVNRYTYDPWGNILSSNEQVENPYRYAGYRHDSSTGLYYLLHRYYDLEIGRFLTKDLHPGALENPQSLNAYVYCLGEDRDVRPCKNLSKNRFKDG